MCEEMKYLMNDAVNRYPFYLKRLAAVTTIVTRAYCSAVFTNLV